MSALFGGGADEEEDSEVQTAAAKPKASKADVETAAAKPSKAKPLPPELAEPADEVAPAKPETPETILAELPARDVPLPVFAPRPKADVGPADMPFGVAEALPEDEEADEELAEGIPLPTWRPDIATEEEGEEADEAEDAVLVAMAEGPVNAARSITIGGEAPLPEARPGDAELALAGLPQADGANDAESKASEAALAMLATGATPEDVLLSRPKKSDRALAIGIGAKTTRKTARAKAADTKPDPKPMVIAAVPEAARWALDTGGQSAAGSALVTTESLAHHMVRTAPSEVYAIGFSRDATVADAGRFSGKAVSFMPVARFATN